MNVSGKAVAIVALAVLLFPVAAMADSTSSDIITWFSTDATTTVSTSSGVLSLTTAITRVTLANNSTMNGSLGWISLTSGTLVGGSLANGCLASSGGCSFSFADSSFKISGSGGAPSWSGEVTPNTDVVLSGICARGGECTYSVIASLSSSNGQLVGSTDLVFTTNGKFKGGSITTSRAGGLTNVTVPEPGTLGLLGVGLFCLAGVLRRKLVRS